MIEQPDVVGGLPLKVDGSIDWTALGEHWKYLASVGELHDYPRPVRQSIYDPRCQSDLLIYGAVLLWGRGGDVVSAYVG